MVGQALAREEEIDTTTIEGAIAHLRSSFPQAVSLDDREGYEGVIVDSNQLLDIARVIRDDLGFDYLSSVTAVDYLGAGDHMEMVYHAYRTSGGGALVFKAQTDRDQAVIPSLVPVWQGADFQEREAWDLFGIKFTGHPTSNAYSCGKASMGIPCARIGARLITRRMSNRLTAGGPADTFIGPKKRTSSAKTFHIQPISTSIV